MSDFIAAYTPLIEIVLLSAGLAYSQFVVLRAGVFSLATAGFASLGAYTGAILVMKYDCPPLLGVVAGTLVGAAAGLALSIPLARLRGAFQAIATVAFIQIVVSLTLYAEELTGGALGLNGIPQSVGLPVLLVFIAVLYLFLRVVLRSSIGRAFDTIRQDENVAVSLGISVARYHRIAFVISGAVAGLSGCLLAYNTHSLTPEQFGFPLLVAALAGVVLGGRALVIGPLIGTALLTLLPELARPLAEQRLVVHGGLLVLTVIFLPQGIADTLRSLWLARRGARRTRQARREATP